MVPGNNSTIEPEIWRVIPSDVALYTSRLMLKGDITRENLKSMEKEVDRAAAELMATVVHVMMIADMVVSFVMEPDWNDRRTAALGAKWGVPSMTGWTAMRDALHHLDIQRFVAISPYPKYLQDLAAPFFQREGFEMTDGATLDVADMLNIPLVMGAEIAGRLDCLDRGRAQAIVLLSTDLPTFDLIEQFEDKYGLPVLGQNQTMLWSALRTIGSDARIKGLGQLLSS